MCRRFVFERLTKVDPEGITGVKDQVSDFLSPTLILPLLIILAHDAEQLVHKRMRLKQDIQQMIGCEANRMQ